MPFGADEPIVFEGAEDAVKVSEVDAPLVARQLWKAIEELIAMLRPPSEEE
jgi:hypothetical protein